MARRMRSAALWKIGTAREVRRRPGSSMLIHSALLVGLWFVDLVQLESAEQSGVVSAPATQHEQACGSHALMLVLALLDKPSSIAKVRAAFGEDAGPR